VISKLAISYPRNAIFSSVLIHDYINFSNISKDIVVCTVISALERQKTGKTTDFSDNFNYNETRLVLPLDYFTIPAGVEFGHKMPNIL